MPLPRVSVVQETDRHDWRHTAACRNEDPELFFPIGDSGPAIQQIEQAKKVCLRCPVNPQCLDWAVETGQDAGVWGGQTEEERRATKRATQRRERLLQAEAS